MTTVFASIVIAVPNGSGKLVMETIVRLATLDSERLVPLVDRRNGCNRHRGSGRPLTPATGESGAACCLLGGRDSEEGTRVGGNGFMDGLAIDGLPFAAAGDQSR